MKHGLITRLTICLAALQVCLGLPARVAQGAEHWVRPASVVELFTSQACSSCPPADALFSELANRADIVALAYHVNYWDYLGWRDTLAHAANNERQNDYMRALGTRSVYTPQMIINGSKDVNGAERSLVLEALEEGVRSGLAPDVDIGISWQDGNILIEMQEGTQQARKAHVLLVYFHPMQSVVVSRGENAGRKMTYWNAVYDIQTAGVWHGKTARYELPANALVKKGGCAILLQEVDANGLPGRILGATILGNRPEI